MLKFNEILSNARKRYKERSGVLDLLILLFGFGNWFVLAAIEKEQPLLVKTAPEGLALPSYLNVSGKLANVSILFYVMMKKIFKEKLNDRYFIYTTMSLDVVAALLLAFFYDKTIEINGVKYSGALMILQFFVVIYGATSNVVCYPYLKCFDGVYITTFFIGREVASLVISGVLALQGIDERTCNSIDQKDDQILFGTRDFMLFIFAMMLVCLVAFYLLNNLKICKELRILSNETESNDSFSCMFEGKTIFWMVIVTLIGAQIYGFHSSIMSYSTVPYGYKAYHRSIILKDVVTTLVCAIPFFISSVSTTFVLVNFFVGSATTLYLLVVAIQSPSPFLVGTDVGFNLVVFAWILTSSTLALSKISLFTKFRDGDPKLMNWSGAFVQIGSILGSGIGFVLVNYSGWFKNIDTCKTSEFNSTNLTLQ